ncbi:hypothetical protein Gpo141_00013063 [Globisporangium polare]
MAADTPSQETLLAQVELLRDQLRQVERQLTLSQRATLIAHRQNVRLLESQHSLNQQHRVEIASLNEQHRLEIARLSESHRAERQQWTGVLTRIDHNVQQLGATHNNIMTLNVVVTVNPEAPNKRHGFAVLLQLKDPNVSLSEYEMRFIIGQEVHVAKEVANKPPNLVLFPFMEVNNAVNLRNNFTRKAKAHLVGSFGMEVRYIIWSMLLQS